MFDDETALWDAALAELGERDRAVLSALCTGNPTPETTAAAVAHCRVWEAVETLDFLLYYGVPGIRYEADAYTLDREVIGYLAGFGIVAPAQG